MQQWQSTNLASHDFYRRLNGFDPGIVYEAEALKVISGKGVDEDDGDGAANRRGIRASSSRNTFHFVGVIDPAEEQYPLRRTFSQSNTDPAFLIDVDKIEY